MITLSANIVRYSNLLKPVGRNLKQVCCAQNLLRTMAYTNRYEHQRPSRYEHHNEFRGPPRNESYDQTDFRHPYQEEAYQHDLHYNDGYQTYDEMYARQRDESLNPRFAEDPVPVTVTCRDLKPSSSGLTVCMSGRVQYQRLGRFLSLKDSHGTIQLVALEERMDLIKRISNMPVDSMIKIVGQVAMRPSHTVNPSLATGAIEVVIHEILDVSIPKRRFPEVLGEDTPGRTGKKSRSSVLLTSAELARCESEAVKKRFLQRTHNCGELDEVHNKLEVKLCGWIDCKRSDRFAVLRDGYGTTQLVMNVNDLKTIRAFQQTDSKSIVTVEGTVILRPQHQRNTSMATGNIEVKVSSLEIVDPNEPVEGIKQEAELQTGSNASGIPKGDQNSYTSRTHNCEQLRGSDVGQDVVLCGWLNSQRGGRFGNIRDGYGSTQMLVPPELEATVGKLMVKTPLESVIRVAGTVCARPPEQVTDKITTGEIEVLVKEYTVLNPAKKDLPFIIRDHNRPKENLRMKYRYLDLRFSDMQYRLRLRSKVLMKMREFLINQRGFVEVETPTLFRRTPGGAQEYVVPTRTEDRFYSLVQSPQQLKQLLMVGAMDRYFQVARCYRDEGARPDRQPEFTQMDIELSFTDRESIMQLIEDLLKASWPEDLKPLNTPIPVLTYRDVMQWYGTDKPDLSFDEKIIDLSECMLCKTEFAVKALVFTPNNADKLAESLKSCRALIEEKQQKSCRLIVVKTGGNKWKETLKNQLSELDTEKLTEKTDIPTPGSLVVGVGPEDGILPLMGKLRQDVFGTFTPNFHFAWVVDFPLFLQGEDGQVESAHHPFTQVHPEDAHLLETEPLKVRGLHFDLVCNGFEVGGGSVRIFDSSEQTRVLKDVLKIPTESLTHLLEALSSGAPPHGGIALGMDRLLSIMVGAESIRDVIAFPKGFDGKDPLCGAPCPITDEEKRLYHLLPRKPLQS